MKKWDDIRRPRRRPNTLRYVTDVSAEIHQTDRVFRSGRWAAPDVPDSMRLEFLNRVIAFNRSGIRQSRPAGTTALMGVG